MSATNRRKPDVLPPPQDEIGPFDSGNILGLFTTVRAHVVLDRRLKDRELRLLLYLALRDVPDKETKQRKGYCYVARDTIAKDLRWSHDTVHRRTASLERLGYLTVERDRGRGRANRYHVTDMFWEPNYNLPNRHGEMTTQTAATVRPTGDDGPDTKGRNSAEKRPQSCAKRPQSSGGNTNKEKREVIVIPAPTAPEELEDDDWPEEDDSLEEDSDLVEDDGWQADLAASYEEEAW